MKLQIYHLPDGCLGIKVGRPTAIVGNIQTWEVWGAILPPDTKSADLQEVVEGALAPSPEPGHDPYHGEKPTPWPWNV
jgi:hypothetical protein